MASGEATAPSDAGRVAASIYMRPEKPLTAMETNELITVLEDAGLSPYQAAAYATLLELGSASASEVASMSDVPQPRIYDVLRSLDELGYVTVYDQDRLYARVDNPSESLTGIKTAIRRYETAIDEIERRYQEPEVRDGNVSLVQRFRTVIDHARDAIEAAGEHVQLAATPSQFTTLQPLLRDAYDRDVHVHLSLYLPSDTDLPFDATKFDGVCTEVRRRELSGPFLVLVDRERAYYATPNRLQQEYGVLIDDYTTAYVFHWYYLTRLWEVYETIYSDRSDDPPYSFVEITECIRAIEPFLESGADVTGRIDGTRIETGRECQLSGRFVDVDYTGSRSAEGGASLLELTAKAQICFETDGTVYTVGGRGAHLEDIAAKRFTIDRIDAGSEGDNSQSP